MSFPPEKNQGLLNTKNGKRRETEVLPSSSESPTSRVYQPGPDSRSRAIPPSPTFNVENLKPPTPPLIRLEYPPESSSSSRAIVSPTFPTSFDNDAPPPSYYSDGFANSASSSNFPPASHINNAVMSVPMARQALGSPPSFARPPSREVTYPNFPPMFLVATGKTLSKGFPYISPPSNSNPHPFASHDVYEVDWMSFLTEAQMVAALSPKQIELSERLPILSILPIVKDLASYGAQQLMKHHNACKVIDCIERWNRHFFEQRKMRIILMKGPVIASGQNEYHDLNNTPTSSSSSSKIESDQKYYNDRPPPSNPSISQTLAGVNDDVYRLFIVPLS